MNAPTSTNAVDASYLHPNVWLSMLHALLRSVYVLQVGWWHHSNALRMSNVTNLKRKSGLVHPPITHYMCLFEHPNSNLLWQTKSRAN